MPNVLEALQQIFREVLDQPELILTRESDSNNVQDWDSFAQISLIMAIEEHYQMKFVLNEFQDIKNVGDMADLISRKIEHKNG